MHSTRCRHLNLKYLTLNNNALTWRDWEPGQFKYLTLNNNALTTVPATMTGLILSTFRFSGTELCVPSVEEFNTFLDGIRYVTKGTIKSCAAAPPVADRTPSGVPPNYREIQAYKDEREVLITLLDESSQDKEHWSSRTPVWEWDDVVVNNAGFVTELNLEDKKLVGSLPAGINTLQYLEKLNLKGNQFTGAVPASLSQISTLTEINLSGNPGLAGPLPATLVSSQVKVLDYSGTGLCPPADDEAFKTWGVGLGANYTPSGLIASGDACVEAPGPDDN